MRSSIRASGLFIFIIAVLVACGSQPPVPDDRFYRLPDAQSTEHKNHKLPEFLLNKAVAIERLETEGLYRERAILYIDKQHPLTLRRYHYHHWVNSPVNIVSEHLLSYLRSALPLADVSRYTAGQSPDQGIRIGGNLVRFERILNDDRPEATVALELWVGKNKGSYRFSNQYSASVQASDSSMHATAIAFGRALEKIYARFMQDLKKEP